MILNIVPHKIIGANQNIVIGETVISAIQNI